MSGSSGPHFYRARRLQQRSRDFLLCFIFICKIIPLPEEGRRPINVERGWRGYTWVRTLVALTEETDAIPSTCMAGSQLCNSNPQGSDTFAILLYCLF